MSLLEVDKGLPLSDRGPKGRATHGVATSRTEMPWIKLKIQLWHQWSHSGQVRKSSSADRTVAWANRKKVSSSKFAAGKRLVKVNVAKPAFSKVREKPYTEQITAGQMSQKGASWVKNDSRKNWQSSMPKQKMKLNIAKQQTITLTSLKRTCHQKSRHETQPSREKCLFWNVQ